jgi:hypothetical protein
VQVAGTRASARCALALIAVLALSSCGLTHLQDLNFRVDKRLSFVSPKARTTVHQPVTITWTMKDFTAQAQGSAPPHRDAGYFAVFVDQTPIRPGHTMDDVAAGDPYCQRLKTCPDRRYLADHHVYTTTQTQMKFPLLPNITGSKQSLQLHTFTVVLMDTSGHRIGESAWELDLRIPKVGV